MISPEFWKRRLEHHLSFIFWRKALSASRAMAYVRQTWHISPNEYCWRALRTTVNRRFWLWVLNTEKVSKTLEYYSLPKINKLWEKKMSSKFWWRDFFLFLQTRDHRLMLDVQDKYCFLFSPLFKSCPLNTSVYVVYTFLLSLSFTTSL